MRSCFIVRRPNASVLRALNYSGPGRLNSRIEASPLGSLAAGIGEGYKNLFTNVDCRADCGIEVLSQTDVFAAEPRGRFIRPSCIRDHNAHRIRKWQILVAGAGQLGESNLFGQAIIADGRLAGKFLAYHCLDFTFADAGSDINLWVYAYLCSRAGHAAINSTAFGTSVPGLRLDLIRELPIPLPVDSVLTRVAANVREAVEQRERYLMELRAARAIIEDLPEMREAHAMCADRRRRTVVWKDDLPTLSAWNFASTGGALKYLRSKWSARLGDIVPRGAIFRGGRYPRVPCRSPHGVELLSQRDVFCIRPVPKRIVKPSVPDELLFAPTCTLLAGGQGTLGEGEIFGQVAYVTPSLARYGVSEHLLRIQAVNPHRGLAYSYLSSGVGLRLLRSTAVGTKLLSLRGDLLRRLPLPEVSDDLIRRITRHLEASTSAVERAAVAESEAIRIVKEEVLPEWLD